MSMLFIMLSLMFSCFGHADGISGYFAADSGHYYLAKTSDGSGAVEIKSGNQDTALVLQKLSTGDFISGSAQVTSSVLMLNNIDFVGLKALLGTWVGDSAWFKFQNFSSVNAQIPAPVGGNKQTVYQYSIAPAADASWRIFISDAVKVQSGKLTITPHQVLVEFENSSEGVANLHLQLNKARSE